MSQVEARNRAWLEHQREFDERQRKRREAEALRKAEVMKELKSQLA
jgi:hypothetical protein